MDNKGPLYRGTVPVLGAHEKLEAPFDPYEYQSQMDDLKRRADTLMKSARRSGCREEMMVAYATQQLLDHNNPRYLEAISMLRRFPVTIDEFIDSKEYMGGTDYEVYPSIRGELRAMNPDVFVGEPPVIEAYLAGSTGSYKTARSLVTNLYQLYLLTCFDRPQRLFNLSPSTPIVFMFQAPSADIADKVLYRPFRDMFTNLPYTRKWIDYDKYKESELHIDNNIQAYPRLPNVEQLVGQAIIGGAIDECNFYTVISQSKQAPGPSGEGGHFDQAQINYNTISRRRENRFQTSGISIGCLVFSSSIRYMNDFLERRVAAAEKNSEPNRHISRAKIYDFLWPRSRVSNDTFRLLVGKKEYGTRILEDFEREGRHYPVGAHIENVPVNYKTQFMDDPEGALRDVLGIASDTITPFITKREKIYAAFEQAKQRGVNSYVVKQNVDLLYDGMPVIDPSKLPRDKSTLRYIHVDLAYKSDRCGIAVVKPAGHIDVLSEDGITETLPFLEVELALSIKPHPNMELEIADVRQWIINLQEVHGIPIATVSYDGFESKESRQLLRKAGINSRLISVDKTMEPYQDFKRALYQDRLAIVENELLATEIANLEYRADKDKVDHPPKGGKDVADAVAGAVYSASQSRVIRSQSTVSGNLRERVRSKSVKRRSFRVKNTVDNQSE